MRRTITLTCLAFACLLGFTTSAMAGPYIQAHRGGSLRAGKPVYPENTMPAFKAAAKLGFTLELDVKLTSDSVPVVIHDDTLDRTTNCTGLVHDVTYEQLERCRVDVLGTDDASVQLKKGDKRRTTVPKLTQVLALLRKTGATASIEIKNLPTDGDFDPTPAYATNVSQTIRRSGVPLSHLIIQSFYPANLNVASEVLPGVQTSFLTLASLQAAAVPVAKSVGAAWVSPQWPVPQSFVTDAHDAGLRVVPFTVDDAAGIRQAFGEGVDAVITNQPVLARKVFAKAEGKLPKIPVAPGTKGCSGTYASRSLPAIRALDPKPGAPRVFAMQFKQDLANVVSYRTFRTKIECMLRRYVLPYRAKGRPNIVAFNEDIGMMTLATGSRGASTRAIFSKPGAGGCAGSPPPCGAIAALLSVGSAYAGPDAAYKSRYPGVGPLAAPFVDATDTFARGWMQTFSDMARRYDLYILGSNNQPLFRESRDPAEIATFADPDLPRPKSVYVATGPEVYNEAFMWGPKLVREEGPPMLRNVVAQNQKVPLTTIEQALGLTPGPTSGADAVANLKPYRVPKTKARIGFATSLPAFQYGRGFGKKLTGSINPCSDVATYYMSCLDRLGTNLVMQDEANPGQWTTDADSGAWQPLEWMSSTWRAAADPIARFDYNVTPHMVGNLADLPFDGQTAITQRGLRGARTCTYVGNTAKFDPSRDPPADRVYSGRKHQFLGLAPWVRKDASRAKLEATGRALTAGSGSKLENDYLETAIVADLPFPPDPHRAACRGARK